MSPQASGGSGGATAPAAGPEGAGTPAPEATLEADGQQPRAQPASADPRPAVPRLRLGDPVADRATEDRPEAWGDRGDSDDQRLARYLAARPPHHGQ